MLCGPRMRCTPGWAATNALTTSSCPSIVAENNDGRAPLEIRYSAIALFPMCEAPPNAVSQSPKPQSHAAHANEGRASTRSFTRFRSKWATVTISRASSGGCVGKRSGTGGWLPFGMFGVSNPNTFLSHKDVSSGSASVENFNRVRRDQAFTIGDRSSQRVVEGRMRCKVNQRKSICLSLGLEKGEALCGDDSLAWRWQ